MVVLATGISASTRVQAVLANSAVTAADLTAALAILRKTGRLQEMEDKHEGEEGIVDFYFEKPWTRAC